jgi:hypothetical protein
MSSELENHNNHHLIDEKKNELEPVKQDELIKEELPDYDSIDYENDPEYKDIPLVVREIVTFEDDPELPSLTFR